MYLGIEDTLTILCDQSYIHHLFSVHDGNFQDAHADLKQLFGVKQIVCCATWCVYEMIKASVSQGDANQGLLEKCMEYAINIPLICGHASSPISSDLCLQGVLQTEMLNPLFFGSTRRLRCKNIRKRTGLPAVFSRGDGVKVVYPAEVTR
ncbi:hypothetical protein Hanom_Chr14g01303901 [Helianthus anomalus]